MIGATWQRELIWNAHPQQIEKLCTQWAQALASLTCAVVHCTVLLSCRKSCKQARALLSNNNTQTIPSAGLSKSVEEPTSS